MFLPRFEGGIWLAMFLVFVVMVETIAAQEPDREQAYSQLATDAAEIDRISQIMRTAAELTFPSIVHIETMVIKPSRTNDGNISGIRQTTAQRIEETGTGIVMAIDNRPWVVTNRHVIGTAEINAVHLMLHDRRQLTVKRILINSDFDIAVLEIAETDVITARLGDSNSVKTAEHVLVIGSPYGLNGTITHGIISAVGRRNIPKGDHPVPLHEMLQTDAAINPGNSGGPLINMRGEVIGIISAIASSSGANEGVGFAIPINEAIRVAKNLVRQGEMRRPYMGVELARTITDKEYAAAGIAKRIGVKIAAVTPDSPAAIAGLHIGDIVLKYNDIEIEDDSHFIRLVAHDEIGNQPTLTVARFRETLTLRPKLEWQNSQ